MLQCASRSWPQACYDRSMTVAMNNPVLENFVLNGEVEKNADIVRWRGEADRDANADDRLHSLLVDDRSANTGR